MKFNPSQPLLTIALSMGLGASLMSSSADGYPAGSAVSYAANPIVSVGGSFSGSDFALPQSPIVAPAENDVVITDVVLGLFMNSGSLCGADVRVEALVDGEVVGRFVVPHGDSNRGRNGTNVHLLSGMRIPQGGVLELRVPGRTWACGSDGNWWLDYTLSGYHAHN